MQQLRGIKSLAVVARSSSTITTVGQRTGIPEKHHHHQKREKQACIQRDFDGSAPAARRAVHEVEQDARRPPFSLPRRPGPPRAPFFRSASSLSRQGPLTSHLSFSVRRVSEAAARSSPTVPPSRCRRWPPPRRRPSSSPTHARHVA